MKRLLPLLLVASAVAFAQHEEHQGMQVSRDGIVMNANRDRLPAGCDAISEAVEVTVRAGRAYANDNPGTLFGMSEPEVRVPSCARVTVEFINEDEVRHQWMVHGLPRYLYPAGMFHIEAMGGRSISGTFIAPAGDRTYLVHCDMAQHMEKGMRAQLVVGTGSGDLWAVPGLSDAYRRGAYLPGNAVVWLPGVAVLAAMLVMWRLAVSPKSRRSGFSRDTTEDRRTRG